MKEKLPMKFLVRNVSSRMHVVDRDILPGMTAEYSEEDFAKYAKPLSNAMQSTNHRLTRGHSIGSDSVYDAGPAELEIYAVIGEDRGLMTVADVANYAADAAKKAAEDAAKKAAEEEAAKKAADKDRLEFEVWKAAKAAADKK